MRALVIDDSRAMRAIIARMMRELPAEVFEAANGQEGLERLAALGGVDLVLVDWNMPVMTGGVRRAVRSLSSTGNQLVMVTNESDIMAASLPRWKRARRIPNEPFIRTALCPRSRPGCAAGRGWELVRGARAGGRDARGRATGGERALEESAG